MTDHLKHAYDPGTDGIICAATLVDSAADPALTLDIARELLREAAEAIRFLHQYRDAMGGEAARYFCDGPDGHFWCDDLELARRVVNAYDKDDDWTITDTHNPIAPPPGAKECG